MTIYVLKYSTDYGSEGYEKEPFTSYSEAVRQFKKYKKLAMAEAGDSIDASRLYHILPDAKPEDHITKYVIKNTADLIKMIKSL
jgi:hypothetical protein